MAFAQDVLSRIINVHWPGALFVLGDDSGQIWRCLLGKKPQFEKMVEQFGEDNAPNGISPGQCNGGSFALVGKTPTFVISGIDWQFDHYDDSGEGFGLFPDGLIKVSNDGISWRTAFETTTTLLGEWRQPGRVIWDENERKFYVDMLYRSASPDMQQKTECWSSATGEHWTLVDSLDGQVQNTNFDVHCKYKWKSGVFAGYGFGNGQFGLNRSPKTDHPPLLGNIVADGLLITQEDLSTDYRGINFAGGIWGRGNGLPFEISRDDGTTWTVAGETEAYDPEASGVLGISVICAGKGT